MVKIADQKLTRSNMDKNRLTGMLKFNLLLIVGIIVSASGCASDGMPPPTSPFPPRGEVLIESYKFRVAIVDFTDQTGLAGELIKTIPDILTTTIFKDGRIDLYERNALRGVSSQDSTALVQDLMEKRIIDGVISGAVTRISGSEKEVVVELRLNSRNKAVMYADSHVLTFRGRRSMEIIREDVAELAKAISNAVPSAREVKVLSKSGTRITLSGGSDNGLIVGMMGYVQSPIDKVTDPVTGDIPRPTYVIVGEVVVDQVTPGSSTGRVLAGDDIRARDVVKFK